METRPRSVPGSSILDSLPKASIPMTPKQRQRINAKNAQKSTGPSTPEGLAISRANAITHGLTAKHLALPSEDKDVVAQQVNVWVDFYQPEEPGEMVLVEEAAKAALTLRRCTRHEKSILEDQAADIDKNWREAGEDRAAELRNLLATDPAKAARELKRSYHGVLWLITRWQVFEKLVKAKGYFGNSELTREAVRLLGCDPDKPREFPLIGYKLLISDASAWETPNEDYLDRLLDGKKIHAEYRAIHGDQTVAQAVARENVRTIVANELAALHRLLSGHEQREIERLGRAKDRAVVPEDGRETRLLLRYHKAAEVAFHKSYKELRKIRAERLADEPASAPIPASATLETVPPVAVEPAPETALRNEPNPAGEPPSRDCEITTYGDTNELVFEPSYGESAMDSEPSDDERELVTVGGGLDEPFKELIASSERLF